MKSSFSTSGIVAGLLGVVSALALAGVVFFRPPQKSTPDARTEPPSGSAADTLELVLDEAFGKDVLVSRWVTESGEGSEVVELRSRRYGAETDPSWFSRARAELEEALELHPPSPAGRPAAAPTPEDATCVVLRVDWREGSGIDHALFLHDCYLIGPEDWAASSEATVRLAQYLFRPENGTGGR